VVEDCALAHIAGVTKCAQNAAWIAALPHPANSPDINIIENRWAILKQRIR
ncbi:hypothetical protein V8E36_009138, partial [Tilletia maclaganii]